MRVYTLIIDGTNNYALVAGDRIIGKLIPIMNSIDKYEIVECNINSILITHYYGSTLKLWCTVIKNYYKIRNKQRIDNMGKV